MLAKEETGVAGIAPGLIVRHTSRRLGKLEPSEACERLVSGNISFSEFVDQIGDGFREVLDFMMEHDLHPGRPVEVLRSIECHATLQQKPVLHGQLRHLYEHRTHKAS